MKPLLASVLTLSSILWLTTNTADAHDKWANGRPIPAWIKSHCCSGDEAVDLGGAGVVHAVMAGDKLTGYKVDGFDNPVAIIKVYPSQDGQVWAFYAHSNWKLDKDQPADAGDHPRMHEEEVTAADKASLSIYCLFVPCHSRDDLPPESELDSTCS